MLNVLGQHVEAAECYVTENPSAHLHMYGKLEAKHNRKMGHVTLFSDVPDEVEEFGEGIDFEMTEEFDELLDDEITTVTLTYTDDLIVPEIADREGFIF